MTDPAELPETEQLDIYFTSKQKFVVLNFTAAIEKTKVSSSLIFGGMSITGILKEQTEKAHCVCYQVYIIKTQ